MALFKKAAAWIVAALVASVLSSVVSSQQVMIGLIKVGARIDVEQRLIMTLQDFKILEILFPVMCACFLVGFLIASFCHQRIGGQRVFWFTLAGATSIVCTLYLMSFVMNLMPVAGARSLSGMMLIALSGALGGFIFTRLIVPKVP
ncbi:hypothetical protein NBRC116583_33440 [Arenicella sp. 4NH20-0111]|uniref:hypothetical protein n=1 Tax=Arenicella sp. 4NH20-0111 TaxID=3127648 RepID=UPI00310365BA